MKIFTEDDSFLSVAFALSPLRKRFEDAGQSLFLVGGVVRDLVSGRTTDNSDLDLTTDALPDRIRHLLADIADTIWLQGERFGTIGARLGGRTLEITTHRSEAYWSDSRKPIVSYSRKLEDDLTRRDFTVNAMAIDLISGTLHDPLGGQVDLKAGLLRTPLSPEESFSDDPLRMLRAARFLAAYGFTPAKGLMEGARAVVPRLGIVSAERIRDELSRLIVLPHPYEGFVFLKKTGQLRLLLPELAALPLQEQDQAFQRLSRIAPELDSRFAALMLDIEVSLTDSRLRSLCFSTATRVAVLELLAGVTSICRHGDEDWSDESIRRLASKAKGRLDDFLTIAKSSGSSIDLLAAGIDRLRLEGVLEDWRPALDGFAVMDLLDLNPGPKVGEIIDWLVELRFSDGFINREEASRRVRERWSKP